MAKDHTLTVDCPDCGSPAGETCKPDCRNDDSFKEPSEVTALLIELDELYGEQEHLETVLDQSRQDRATLQRQNGRLQGAAELACISMEERGYGDMPSIQNLRAALAIKPDQPSAGPTAADDQRSPRNPSSC